MMNKTLAMICASALALCSQGSNAGESFSVGPRFAWTPRYYSLDLKESKKVPVHPDDAGFLQGETSVKAGSSLDFGVLTPGIEGRWYTKKGFNFFGGADIELDFIQNGVNYYQGKHDVGMYETRQQSSDRRPAYAGSFVYDSLQPEQTSVIPFVGASLNLGEHSLDLEYDFANRKFEREWGHHRYDTEEKVGSEKYAAKGNRIIARWNYREDKWTFGINLGFEDYELEKSDNSDAGKIKSYSIGLSAKRDF